MQTVNPSRHSSATPCWSSILHGSFKQPCIVTAGETEHGNGLQGDARQDAGNIQLSGRPQQPERTFQGETVALTPEHLSMLIECLTLNSPLFQAYSRERLGLEAAELVAMSSGQVSVCWCPVCA